MSNPSKPEHRSSYHCWMFGIRNGMPAGHIVEIFSRVPSGATLYEVRDDTSPGSVKGVTTFEFRAPVAFLEGSVVRR